ncbi:MAG: phage holin family protein [Pseudomonas sp.]|uniref:phage holin family protein n=1 Tax=Pseudomonas sp. TaxID=306 RepID=UPI0027354DD5|nr:phage holin family protein [Pseudomonas sp.]MDP3848683.1 phage holin family protein [Pseudomonas sp.]
MPEQPAAPFTFKPLAVLRLLRATGSAWLAQASLHGQLLRIEWAQEQQRLLSMLLMTLLGFSCLLCALLLLSALVLILSWDSELRIPVWIALIAFYSLGAGLAWWRFNRLSALGEQAFAATRTELNADLNLLKSKL